jgi:predicted nucleotidyltransferase
MSKLEDHTLILQLTAGSHMYGTNTAESDIDTRGVFMPNINFLLGTQEIKQIRDEVNDKKHYAFGYFMLKLREGIMDPHDWLWAPEESYSYISDIGKRLIENRKKFLSTNIANKIFGYMNSAYKRITRRNVNAMGAKRKANFEQHGYDTKDASHAVRLAMQGFLLLTKGVFYPRLPDEYLDIVKAIKAGKMGLNRVRQLIDEWMEYLEKAKEGNNAEIPRSADDYTNEFTVKIHREYLEAN